MKLAKILFFLFFLSCSDNNDRQGTKEKSVTSKTEVNKINHNAKKDGLDSQVLCGFPKYYNLFHENHQDSAYFDFEQGVECARYYVKPILLVFDGWGSFNSRKMQNDIFSKLEISNYLNENYVTIYLYVDDKTKLPKEEWNVSELTGRTNKTIGAKNVNIQISKFRNGTQPSLAILDNNEKLISEIKSYTSDVDEFLSWLIKGKKDFLNSH